MIGAPGKGSGKTPNIYLTKKNNKKHRNFDSSKDSLHQGDYIINLEVDHNDNEDLKTKTPLELNCTIQDKTLLAPPQTNQESHESVMLKNDTMGGDMTELIPETEPEVIKVELTSSKNQANVEHASHSGLTPNPVTSNNVGSPVPSTQIPHHLIIPQPSDDW
ncbi:hypothetical protein O181_037866 [Austropuccinia psidii MF-1]|uniref:Uncharacterized protein n=1 Tax=Austropuccinia psidii MF-1 TaxID=1389203 RepID=A0A9Q3D710_9BASI|nr:hypothetical protein [Austropuccinia psidii MF-1]